MKKIELNLGVGMNMFFSEPVVIEIEDGGDLIESYEKYLEFCNSEISKAILSETLTTEVTDKGTYAAAKTHRDILHHLVQGDKRLVEKTINKLIAMIWELNFPPFAGADMPLFQLYAEDEIHKSLAERDKILQKQGVVFQKEYFKRYYNLKEDEFEMKG